MRVLVVGLGSIARRHCGILNGLVPGVEIVGLDPAFREDFWSEKVPPPGKVASDWADLAGERFDLALIASPSAMHLGHTRRAIDLAERVFVEKPICTQDVTEAQAAIAEADRERVTVGANLRFHSLSDVLRDWIAAHEAEPSLIRIDSLSWLPSWHPWADYRTEYSARADLGGGVALDSIHELDLALWLAGPADEVKATSRNSGVLEIETEDWAGWSWRAGSASVVVEVSYAQRVRRRSVTIECRDAGLRVDWLAGTATETGADGERELASVDPGGPLDEMYERQWRAVLAGDPRTAGWDDALTAVALARRATTPSPPLASRWAKPSD